MKFKDLVKDVDKETPKEKEEIFMQIVTEDHRKNVRSLTGCEIKDGKCILIGTLRGECVNFDFFKTAIHAKESEYAEFDCMLKAEDSDIMVPLKRAYVSPRDKALILEADYSEFDKTDPKITEEIFYDAHYGNRTDAIKELFHVLKCLNLEFARPTREIKYTKVSPTRAKLRAKVTGTATRLYDLRNGSYFVPDKESYIRAGIKW